MLTTKEFKTFDQQINGLIDRKLKFKNKNKALSVLKQYNYFDIINGFESILLKPNTEKKVYENVYFEDFYELYKFDIALNKQTLFNVFDIELKLRTSIAYHFAKIYCNTKSTTMKYIDKSCYQAPDPADRFLSKKFNKFDLFRKEEKKNGGHCKLSYIDELKESKEYINKYDEPPFWVVIKAMPLGTLYFTFLFCNEDVKLCVLQDFGFSESQSSIFVQSIYMLKEIRNHCAHLELVTRLKIKKEPKLNCYNDITAFAGLSKTADLKYMDALKNFKLYGSIWNIKRAIIKFYIKMCIKGRRRIARKILGKMGHQSILTWMFL